MGGSFAAAWQGTDQKSKEGASREDRHRNRRAGARAADSDDDDDTSSDDVEEMSAADVYKALQAKGYTVANGYPISDIVAAVRKADGSVDKGVEYFGDTCPEEKPV